ncbi:nascent polypeptide-associated complex subunit alpha, muscle-specific form-like [Frieseomelitta varia]|uniref:nascent polypeptide-associated complex subunit alpha, muscle-specific form-like n=1 Tax=Frieseomelitta varia TaxID=561572 RepID=UPI001CB6904A|nr:nascent polypeptide-associated complex subunit alpha, muscle-specific form-like [Frieseomelitta varia]
MRKATSASALAAAAATQGRHPKTPPAIPPKAAPHNRKSPPGPQKSTRPSTSPPGPHKRNKRAVPSRGSSTPPASAPAPKAATPSPPPARPARSWPTPPPVTPVTTFVEVVKGRSPLPPAPPFVPLTGAVLTADVTTTPSYSRPIPSPTISPPATGIVPVMLLSPDRPITITASPALTRGTLMGNGTPRSPTSSSYSSICPLPTIKEDIRTIEPNLTLPPVLGSPRPAGSNEPIGNVTPPPSETIVREVTNVGDEDTWTPVRARRRRSKRASPPSPPTRKQQQLTQQQQPQQQLQQQPRCQPESRQSPQPSTPPAAADSARPDAGRGRTHTRPRGACVDNTIRAAGHTTRPGVIPVSRRPGAVRGCVCRCTCGRRDVTVATRRGERVHRRNPPSSDGSAPRLTGPAPATPLGGRRSGENSAPSLECEITGVRNPPPPASNGRRRRHGAVNGESLSAKAAAARTRAALVEEANAVQTSEQLEAVATNLARLFPARRVTRTNANVNIARSASADRPRRANAATQPVINPTDESRQRL